MDKSFDNVKFINLFMFREKAYYPASKIYKYLTDHGLECQECNKAYETTKFNSSTISVKGTVSFMMENEMF